MRFASPYSLYLLLIIPVLVFFYVFTFRQKKKALALFGNLKLVKNLTASVSKPRQIIKTILVVTGFFFLILALTGPQIGTKLVQVKRKGLDIIIAIDTSLSMTAEDIKPNRLAKAKMELESLIDQMEGDRIGIIAFAGNAFVQCPLTLDYRAAKMFLNLINTDLIPQPGTSIGEAIRLAIKSFSQKERKYKVLILLTDGEDYHSLPLKAGDQAKKEGIKIYTIGFGSPKGELIPLYDEKGDIISYKKDKKGAAVMSKLDEMTLGKIALNTGGKYYRATAGELEVEQLYKEISRLEKKELQSKFFSQYEDRFQYFLAICLILLFFELILPARKKLVEKL
ncbi:VWA domain-containing protein [bacterium]|nr:VWA domain-containing protein [bacterium]